jgi:dTDP-4-dehydrorhamnose 3,5-epimerase
MPPFAQGKLVRCIKGEIFDIAVDIRKSSKTFLQWIGIYLNSKNCNMLYIPPGFAHGFYTMQDNSEVIYKTTAEYSPECDRGILWSDPKIGIKLPTNKVQLSEKDKALPNFDKAELFP